MFIINWGELDGRVDPEAYHPEVKNVLLRLKTINSLTKLNYVAAMVRDSTNNLQAGIPYIGLENIQSDTGVLISVKDTNEISGQAFKFKRNDVLFPKLRPYLNKVWLANFDGYCSTEFCVFRTSDIEYSKFLRYFLNSSIVVNQTKHLMCGNTLPRLQIESIENLYIPDVDGSTQQQIIEIMDAAYAEKQQKEKEAKDLLGSINSYLLGELGIAMPSEEENTLESRKFYANSADVLDGRFDPFYYKPIYDKYDEALNAGKYTVSTLGKYINYITYGASVDNSYQQTGIPLLRIKDLSPNEINSDDIVYLPLEIENKLRTSRVDLDDLLITRSGTIGVCSVVDKKHSGFAFGSFMIKFTLSCVNPQYVSYYVNSIIGQKYFGRNKIGAIQGNITIPTIKLLPIPIPDTHIQTQIVDKISSIRNKAKQLEQEADDAVKSAKAKVEKILLEGSL